MDKVERVLIRNGYMIYRGKRFSWKDDRGIVAANNEDLALLDSILKKYEELKN